MKRFWRKQRPKKEAVRRMNEAVALKDIYRTFGETVRECDYFREWRKKGQKKFQESGPGLAREIELIYADKWSAVVGRCAYLEVRVSIDSDITRSHFCMNVGRDGDKLTYSFMLVPGQGICGSSTMDDSWKIADEGLNKFAKSLVSSLKSDLVPWLQRCTDAISLLEWMDAESLGKARWPLMLTLGKTADIRRELREIIKAPPEDRMLGREIEWISETEILTPAEAEELKLANMQAVESYIRRMKKLAISMEVSG